MNNNLNLQADYLVMGAGATAMAFVDTLLSESPNATVLMVVSTAMLNAALTHRRRHGNVSAG